MLKHKNIFLHIKFFGETYNYKISMKSQNIAQATLK